MIIWFILHIYQYYKMGIYVGPFKKEVILIVILGN